MTYLDRHRFHPSTLSSNQKWAAWESHCCRSRQCLPPGRVEAHQRDHAERYARARREYAIAYGYDTEPEVSA